MGARVSTRTNVRQVKGTADTQKRIYCTEDRCRVLAYNHGKCFTHFFKDAERYTFDSRSRKLGSRI